MSTSYTVFLSDGTANSPPKRGDRESEPEAEIQVAPERARAHKMLFDSSAVIATKGCKWTAMEGALGGNSIEFFQTQKRPILATELASSET